MERSISFIDFLYMYDICKQLIISINYRRYETLWYCYMARGVIITLL